MAEDILGEFKFEGYQQPSAYKMGKGAFETAVKGIGYKNIDDFNEYLASKGIGNVGKDANATKELNRLRVEAGLEPYRKIPPIQAKAEKIITDSSDPVTTRSKRAMINIGLKSISDRAEKIDGDENKLRFIIQEVSERFPQLAREMVQSVARKLFLAVPLAGIVAEIAMSPSAEAAEIEPSFEDMMMKRIRQSDFSGPSASSMLLEQLSQDATMKAGGGMMNINDMTRPVGYKEGTKDGTLVGDKEKLFGGKNRARIEKFVNEMIEGEGVTKDLGRGILSAVSIPGIAIKDLIEFLNPVKEAEGSEAFDELISKRQVLISRLNGERLFGGDENEIKSIMDQIKRIDEMMSMLRPKED